jgi:glycosyltransferase involved in cell wall biosynthesis
VSPKVTVLLPVYGGEEYVAAAVESVLAQTFQDFELLVVDDCGPRTAIEIVAGFGDPRIRIVRNDENLGQVRSLNAGLAVAQGEYVARLDQDDICLRERLAWQVAVLDAEPETALVGTWLHRIDGSGRRISTLRGHIRDRAELVFLLVTNRFPVAHPTATFRRAVALDVGGYDPAFRFSEDQDLWRRVVLAGHAARVVEEPLVLYRVHETMQSLRNWDEQQQNNLRSLDGFLGALTSAAPATELRRALTWEAGPVEVDVASLVEDVGRRLPLTDAEAEKLRRLLGRRLAAAALAAGARSLWGPARRGAGRVRPLRSLVALGRRLR